MTLSFIVQKAIFVKDRMRYIVYNVVLKIFFFNLKPFLCIYMMLIFVYA